MKFRSIFLLAILTLVAFPAIPVNSSASLIAPPVECLYIVYDSELDRAQICLTVTSEELLLNWSKYDIYIRPESGDRDDFISLPKPGGTLAYRENHYLNATGIVNETWLYSYAGLSINEIDSNRRVWTRMEFVQSGNITEDYTVDDDYDTGVEIDWDRGWGDDVISNPVLETCFFAGPVVVVMGAFFLMLYLLLKKKNRYWR